MRTLQEKFFKMLSQRISQSLGAEVVIEPTAANCGTAHIMQEAFFKPVVTFTYHFQSGHNTFTIHGKGDQFILAQNPAELEQVFHALFDNTASESEA